MVDDSEARYVIDQFNKLASWRVRYLEILFPYLAVSVAIAALYNSAVGLVGGPTIFVLVVLALLVITTLLASDRYIKYKDKLVLLEAHRLKYKSLPDSITLGKIAGHKFKKKDLIEELEKAERSIMQRGHL